MNFIFHGKPARSKFFSGFTITEMLVVLFITAVVAGVAAIGIRSGSSSGALNRAAARTALDLRRAQNLALTSFTFQGAPAFGFGVYFDLTNPTQYIVFADTNGDNKRTSSAEDFEIVKIEQGVALGSLSSGSFPLTINFRSPEPTTFIWNGSLPASSATITLISQSDPTLTKQIIINNFGLVDF